MQSTLSIPRSRFPLWRALVVIGIVAATLALTVFTSAPYAKPEAGVVMTLPSIVTDYVGLEQPVSEAELALLPKDTTFAKKAYGESQGLGINAQIVLGGADKRSIHRPEVCLPGQGWTIKSTQKVEVPLDNGSKLSVTKLILSRPQQIGPQTFRPLPMVYIYWFVSKDFTTPDHMTRILTNAWDMLFHNKLNRWAYVIVSAPVLQGFTREGKNEEETVAMLKSFIGEFAPDIMLSEMAKKQ